MKNSHHFRTNRAIEAYGTSQSLWDKPLFESHSFVAVPTVGALVEGWLLVVPRTPALSFARLSTPLYSEFEIFLNQVVDSVQLAYGPASVFEHGPTHAASAVGCGVDYAHLHVVPLDCDLLAGAKHIAPSIQWRTVDSIRDIGHCTEAAGGYWFVQQPFAAGACYIGTCPDEKGHSQLFRKVIANHVGRPNDFDWKQCCGLDAIAATVEKLTEAAVLV